MSRIEQLIKELCPNGVEYKKLSEIATVARGVRVVREQLMPEGEIPVYQNSLKPLGYNDKANVKANSAFVIGAGAAGEIGFSNVDFWAADDCYYPESVKSIPIFGQQKREQFLQLKSAA